MVKRFLAQLYIPTESGVHLNENHSNTVQFALAEDQTYRTVVRFLKEWIDSITESYGTERSFS
jgi:hypothetical protein